MSAIIEVKNLSKMYSGNALAVDGVSFKVEEGEFFGFLGPNGAGKTTVIKILAALLRPTAGEAKVAGFDVKKEQKRIHEQVGFALQIAGLDQLATGREHLILAGHLYHLPKEEIKKRAEELLGLVQLNQSARNFVSTYSGGMRRRLDLALALVHRPKLLFLDEPTTGLDPHARQSIWSHLRKLNQEGVTIFLTTHSMEEADALCQRLAIIDRGKIVAEGTPEELKRKINPEGKVGLEEVFIKLTGHSLGNEAGNLTDPFITMRYTGKGGGE